jgi:CheY-like chemotaxis protein
MNKRSILIVEDDQDLCDAYATILKTSGFETVTAGNGQEALDVIQAQGHPRVIFLDLRMPVMDGLGFLREYNMHKHKDTTIVVFSNFDANKEIDAAYELGADRYVLKAKIAPKELIQIATSLVK